MINAPERNTCRWLIFICMACLAMSSAFSVLSSIAGLKIQPEFSRGVAGLARLRFSAVGVIFNTPASFASIVGLNVGFNGLELDAFDAGNNLLATTTIFGTTEGGTAGVNPPGETFTLSVSVANIARLAIYQPITTFNDTIVLDNFSAEVGGAAVPEPATLTLRCSPSTGVAPSTPARPARSSTSW